MRGSGNYRNTGKYFDNVGVGLGLHFVIQFLEMPLNSDHLIAHLCIAARGERLNLLLRAHFLTHIF